MEKGGSGRSINLFSVMEGEIASTGETRRFGLQGVQPVLVAPLTPLKSHTCPVCSVQILFLVYTVQYSMVCHTPLSVLFNHSFSSCWLQEHPVL